MYQALYRKYRPIDFNSVVGQDSLSPSKIFLRMIILLSSELFKAE